MGGRLGFIEPMMPTLVDTPPRDGDWSTEVKFDGWRVQIIIDQGALASSPGAAMTGPTGRRSLPARHRKNQS